MKTGSFALALCSVLLISTAAFADSEAGHDRRAAGILREIAETSLIENTASFQLTGEGLAIYSLAKADAPGVAARLFTVRREGSSLVVSEEFGQEHRVPYATRGRADNALRALLKGASIDLHACLATTAQIVSKKVTESDVFHYCRDLEKTLEVSCGLIDATPLLRDADLRAYDLTDIAAHPLTRVVNECHTYRFHKSR